MNISTKLKDLNVTVTMSPNWVTTESISKTTIALISVGVISLALVVSLVTAVWILQWKRLKWANRRKQIDTLHFTENQSGDASQNCIDGQPNSQNIPDVEDGCYESAAFDNDLEEHHEDKGERDCLSLPFQEVTVDVENTTCADLAMGSTINVDKVVKKDEPPAHHSCGRLDSPSESGYVSGDFPLIPEGKPVNQPMAEVRHKQTRVEKLIEDGKLAFDNISGKKIGHCYASEQFSAGLFDSKGGFLRLANNRFVKIVIPPGALEGPTPQLIYLLMHFENNDLGNHTPIMSAKFECGEDGLQFKVPLTLTFPHAATNPESLAVSHKPGDSSPSMGNSGGQCPELIEVTPETMTLSIHHFCGYGATCKPGSQSGKRLYVTVLRRAEEIKMYFITDANSEQLKKYIESEESKKSFREVDAWKPFNFVLDNGGLVIEVVTKTDLPYMRCTFDDQIVLSYSQNCMPLNVGNLELQVTFRQQGEETDTAVFNVDFQSALSPRELVSSDSTLSLTELQELPDVNCDCQTMGACNCHVNLRRDTRQTRQDSGYMSTPILPLSLYIIPFDQTNVEPSSDGENIEDSPEREPNNHVY